MSLVSKSKNMFRVIRWRDLAARIQHCPACNGPSLMLRLARDEIWVRCARCRASSVTLSLVSVLRSQCPDQMQGRVYEMSARGALFDFLKAQGAELVGSEFVQGAAPGSILNGIRCEDVQALSFNSREFDLVTATEVFEHVPDDRAGFGEVLRVLKNGGWFVFTVPLHDSETTRQRARLTPAGRPEFLLPAEYHADPAKPGVPVLTFRDYGKDILATLMQAGFESARLVEPADRMPWGYARRVIVARKREAHGNPGLVQIP